MAKINKKALGLGLAGVMSLGAVVSITNQIASVDAATSQAYQDAKAKIEHTIYSINENYAGIKNQVTWESYIAEARELVAQMPASESKESNELAAQLDGLADTVLAIARINHVEKSYDVNFHGIKNAAQWREYLDLAKEDMESIDKTVFQAKYDELVERYNDIETKVKEIEDAHQEDLTKVQEDFNAVKESLSLEEAKEALENAKKLGTHETSAKIVKEIEAFIAEFDETVELTNLTATDSKNLNLEGKGLVNIKAGDISVEGNSVKSLKISDDFTYVNIELEREILPNFETKVTIKVDGVDKEFKVTNGVEVKTVAVNGGTFGHDRKGQFVTFKVNGQDMTADYLKSAGYEVKFVATNTTGVAASIFNTGNNASTTGELADNIDLSNLSKQVKVEVQIIKNGTIVVSGEEKITIVNLNQTATVINTVELFNLTNPTANAIKYGETNQIGNEDGNGVYKMNSTTLVTGEQAAIGNVMANINGDDTHVKEANVEVKSSNTGVVSISKGDTTDNVLKAQSPGTAVITVKVGNAEKTINITVTSTKRTLTKVSLDKPSATAAKLEGSQDKVKVKTLDQYGDPIAVKEGGIKLDAGTEVTSTTANETCPILKVNGKETSEDIAKVVVTDKPASIGETTLVFTANNISANSASGQMNFVSSFKNPNTNITDKSVLATLRVNVTNQSTTASSKLQVVGVSGDKAYSKDFILDKNKDNKVRVDLTDFNESGLNLGTADLYEYGVSEKEEEKTPEENTGGDPEETPGGTSRTVPGSGTYYTVEIVNKDIVDFVKGKFPGHDNNDNDNVKYIELEAKAKGSTDIVVRKVDSASSTGVGTFVTKQTITVEDSKVQITNVTFKSEIQPVTNYSNRVYLKDLMTVEESGKDMIIKGLTLSNNSKANVRLNSKKVEDDKGEVIAYINDLYLDLDGNGEFSENDEVIGSMGLDASTDSDSKGTVDGILNDEKLSDYLVETPERAYKELPMLGTVILKVYSEGQSEQGEFDATSVVGTTQFKVDIRKN